MDLVLEKTLAERDKVEREMTAASL